MVVVVVVFLWRAHEDPGVGRSPSGYRSARACVPLTCCLRRRVSDRSWRIAAVRKRQPDCVRGFGVSEAADLYSSWQQTRERNVLLCDSPLIVYDLLIVTACVRPALFMNDPALRESSCACSLHDAELLSEKQGQKEIFCFCFGWRWPLFSLCFSSRSATPDF